MASVVRGVEYCGGGRLRGVRAGLSRGEWEVRNTARMEG